MHKALTLLGMMGLSLWLCAGAVGAATPESSSQGRTSTGACNACDAEKDILDTVTEHGSFGILIDLVNRADMAWVLKTDGPLTLLAPTDDAFLGTVPEHTLEELKKPENRDKLRRLLANHVLSGTWPAGRIFMMRSLTTWSGQVETHPDRNALSLPGGPGAVVVTKDVRCTNGIVHAIDRVLLARPRVAAGGGRRALAPPVSPGCLPTPARHAPPREDLSEYVERANAFAAAVSGGDDQQYVLSFLSALNVADARGARPAETCGLARAARTLSIARWTDNAMRPEALPPNSIFTDPVYIANAKRLIRERRVRIVDGVETDLFPDCVAVGSSSRWCCTGTLIAPRVVITAGHCHPGCTSRVFVGPNVQGDGETIGVATAVRHLGYTSSFENDLTLLYLEREVAGVTPRRIAPGGMIDDAYFVRLAGYGTTDTSGSIGYGIRRMVDVPVASRACASDEAVNRYGCHRDLEIVAGAPFLDKDSCRGDSGGPAYVRAEGEEEWFLAGATSRATEEAIRVCGDGGIYARLDRYADWIERTISDFQSGP
ncbi:MAG TPA: trypsin-like serine protease [Thermoguttaceae bacterium]|nr:trypsin-like serine protease [Thermoguttaceae bacterium]